MKTAQITDNEYNKLYLAWVDFAQEKDMEEPGQAQKAYEIDQVLEIIADRLYRTESN
jgi:hypothetical protein